MALLRKEICNLRHPMDLGHPVLGVHTSVRKLQISFRKRAINHRALFASVRTCTATHSHAHAHVHTCAYTHVCTHVYTSMHMHTLTSDTRQQQSAHVRNQAASDLGTAEDHLLIHTYVRTHTHAHTHTRVS